MFGREFDIGGNPGDFREPALGDQAGIIGRAARDKPNSIDPTEVERDLLLDERAIAVTILNDASDGRLLINFLQHVVGEAAVVVILRHRVDDGPGANHGAATLVEDHDRVTPQFDLVAVAQHDSLVGQAGESRNVGRKIGAVRTDRRDERAAGALGVKNAGIILGHDGDRVRAGNLVAKGAHGALRPRSVLDRARDQPGNDLAVRFAPEFAALPPQAAAQFAVVLDDAVMNDGDTVGDMRMRVDLARRPVGRPAGVGDPNVTVKVRLGHAPLQRLNFADRADPLQPTVIERRDPGGIVTPVLQALQASHQYISDGLVADRRKNSTHRSNPRLMFDKQRSNSRATWKGRGIVDLSAPRFRSAVLLRVSRSSVFAACKVCDRDA